MTQEMKAKTTKRPYSKPQLEQVRLVAEEAVLLNCKMEQIHGPEPALCRTPGPPCLSLGS